MASESQKGAAILKRYKHPAAWKDGFKETSKVHHRGKMLLKVEEIRLGGQGFVSRTEAHANALAIRAWATSVGLTGNDLSLDQVPDRDPYVMVPKAVFPKVLPLLKAL